MRGQPAANLAHLDGAGIAKANLLTRATGAEQVAAVQAAAPGRFIWFASADIAQTGALSGRIVADVKTASQTLRATLLLGGTVKEPQVKN